MLTIEFYENEEAIIAHSLQTDCPATVNQTGEPGVAHVIGTSSSRDFMKRPGIFTILMDKVEAQRMFTGMSLENVTPHRSMGRFHARLRG